MCGEQTHLPTGTLPRLAVVVRHMTRPCCAATAARPARAISLQRLFCTKAAGAAQDG